MLPGVRTRPPSQGPGGALEPAMATGLGGWSPSVSRGALVTGEGTSEAAPETVRQAVGGGCQSGWGRLLSVTVAVEAGTCH